MVSGQRALEELDALLKKAQEKVVSTVTDNFIARGLKSQIEKLKRILNSIRQSLQLENATDEIAKERVNLSTTEPEFRIDREDPLMERMLLEMRRQEPIRKPPAGTSVRVIAVDANLEIFSDLADEEKLPELMMRDKEGLVFHLMTSRGETRTAVDQNLAVWQDLSLKEGDAIRVTATYRGEPMQTLGGSIRPVLFGPRADVVYVQLSRRESWIRKLSGYHWSATQPPYLKPWYSSDFALCAPWERARAGRESDQFPDLWSEGLHPDARREYFVIQNGEHYYLEQDRFNSRCEYLITLRWRLNFFIPDRNFGFEDELSITDMSTGNEQLLKGWFQGYETGLQPNPMP